MTIVLRRCAITMRVRVHPVHALRDDRLRAVVEGAGRLVEEDDLRPVDERARDQQPLPLAARERAAALGDDGVHPHRHLLDVLGEPGHRRRLPRVVHACARWSRRCCGRCRSAARGSPAARRRAAGGPRARRASTGPGRRSRRRRSAGRSNPSSRRSSVDLPQPEAPTKATNSPGLIVNETSLMTHGPVGRVAEAEVRDGDLAARACPGDAFDLVGLGQRLEDRLQPLEGRHRLRAG